MRAGGAVPAAIRRAQPFNRPPPTRLAHNAFVIAVLVCPFFARHTCCSIGFGDLARGARSARDAAQVRAGLSHALQCEGAIFYLQVRSSRATNRCADSERSASPSTTHDHLALSSALRGAAASQVLAYYTNC